NSYSPSESSEWISDSSVACRGTSSMSQSRFASATVCMLLGSASSIFSTDSSHCSSVMVTNVASTGSSLLTVIGAHYGITSYSARLTGLTAAEASSWIGHSSAESSNWVSDTSIRSQTSQGSGKTSNMYISIAHASGTLSESLSFEANSISS
ncbi:hypothetical protein GUITHDRAFT_47720, partial [Guillardia theta CCMP2712]